MLNTFNELPTRWSLSNEYRLAILSKEFIQGHGILASPHANPKKNMIASDMLVPHHGIEAGWLQLPNLRQDTVQRRDHRRNRLRDPACMLVLPERIDLPLRAALLLYT